MSCPPTYFFVVPPTPWDVFVCTIRGWNMTMTIIVSVVIFLGGLRCCGRRYYQRREHLQNAKDTMSVISDM